MMRLFDIAAKRREEIEKEAMLTQALRGAATWAGRVGKTLVKNPVKTLGAGGTAFELHQAAGKGSDLMSGARNIYKSMAKAPRPRATM